MYWGFCRYAKQEICNRIGEDNYREYGQVILSVLINICSEDFTIVRYPEDEEIEEVIKRIKEA